MPTLVAMCVMTIGIIISIVAVIHDDIIMILLGQSIITSVSILWWAWIMTTINTIMSKTNHTIQQIVEVKTGIEEVRELLEPKIFDDSDK